jgi:outer membrane protein insertion porin family
VSPIQPALMCSRDHTRSSLVVVGIMVVALFGRRLQADDVSHLHGQRITAVRFSPTQPNQNELLRYVEIHAGDDFSIQGVRRSIKVLYHLGLFGQVRAVAHRDASGVAVTFLLEPMRRIVNLQFIGNDAISKGKLTRLVKLARGDEYDHGTMESAVDDILDLYRKHGYRRTQVIARAEGSENGDVEVRFYIQEGPVTRISTITFVGQLAFDRTTLAEEAGIESGDPLDEERLQKATKRLTDFYRHAGYLEVALRPPTLPEPAADREQEPLAEEVTFDIQSGPKISFTFVGESAIDQKTLLDALELHKQVTFSSSRIRDLTDRLQQLYQKKGYAHVRVTAQVAEEQKPGGKEIVFRIDEGPRVVVQRIEFVGNRAFRADQLSAFISDALLDAIVQPIVDQPIDRGDVDTLGGGYPVPSDNRNAFWPMGFWFDLDPDTIYLQEPYENALGKIKNLYQSHGFLDIKVGEPVLSFDRSGSRLYITIPITEGVQTFLSAISFDGNQAMASDELLRMAEGKSGLVQLGKPLNLYTVEELRKEIVRDYARRGYIYSQVNQTVTRSEDRSLAEVLFEINEGAQVRVRRVLIRGDVFTKRTVFDHTLRLHPGQIYSPEEATLSQGDLLDLGIFSNVDVKLIEPEHPEAEKDVAVYVREQSKHALTFSPGLSSGEGVRLELEYNQRNLFGYAMEFVGRAQVSYQVFYPILSDAIRTRYEHLSFWEGLGGWVLTGLHWPRVWWLWKGISARMDLIGLQEHAVSYDLTKVSLTPGVDIKLTPQINLTFEYEFERNNLRCPDSVKICGGAAAGKSYLRYDAGNFFLGTLRPQISWDRRDNIFLPHSGGLVMLRTELVNSLSSDHTVFLFKVEGSITGYLPLSRKVTVALSLRGGLIKNLNPDSNTPSHKLFFLGGRNTVRSYEEDNLIPQDQSSCTLTSDASGATQCISLGGNAYWLAKGEFRFPVLSDTVEGALFVDVGNLWMDSKKVELFKLRKAAGFGVRIITPIGPIAFDVGFNLSPDPNFHEQAWTLHFNIGVF